MKKAFILSVVVCLALIAGIVLAQESVQRPGAPNPKAYEHASDQAIFNRVSDWFATVGRAEEKREQILNERRAERAQKRIGKEAEKQAREAQRQLKAQEQKGRQAQPQTQTRPGAGPQGAPGRR